MEHDVQKAVRKATPTKIHSCFCVQMDAFQMVTVLKCSPVNVHPAMQRQQEMLQPRSMQCPVYIKHLTPQGLQDWQLAMFKMNILRKCAVSEVANGRAANDAEIRQLFMPSPLLKY